MRLPLMMACGCALVLTACASASRPSAAQNQIVFITRDGCVATDAMRANLDGALRTLGRPANYQVIDADVLPEDDRRGGYGTPTVLVDNVDLFGMPEPPLPHPPAT